MARADITVRGAGIFGLCIAWEAAQRGARVRVTEAQSVGAGASGGPVGALTPHVPENWNVKKAFQLDSLLMAPAFWSGVEAASGKPSGYARLGRLQPIADGKALDLARAREDSAAQLWAGHAHWQVRKATGAAWEPFSQSGFLVHDSLSARLNPRLAAQALCAAIQRRGGEIIIGEGEDLGSVIWATGLAGLTALSADLDQPMGGGVKGQAALIRFDARQFAQIYADNLHIVPHSDGTVAIGSTSENNWQSGGETDEKLDAVVARAIAVLPVLKGAEVIERWAGLRPRAASRAPLLGAWPNRPGHFVANGGFKIGFGMAPKVAQVIADLVLEGRNTIPAEFAF